MFVYCKHCLLVKCTPVYMLSSLSSFVLSNKIAATFDQRCLPVSVELLKKASRERFGRWSFFRIVTLRKNTKSRSSCQNTWSVLIDRSTSTSAARTCRQLYKEGQASPRTSVSTRGERWLQLLFTCARVKEHL